MTRKIRYIDIKTLNSQAIRLRIAAAKGALYQARSLKRTFMKRTLLMAALLFAALPLAAQRLIIGERAPELKVERWLTSAPSTTNKAVMVEFFHSSNPQGTERLARLDELARNNKDKLTVVVVTRENDTVVTGRILEGNPSYYVGYDGEGTAFTSFEARYVPYSVIYDKRGRVLWVGNPSSLSNTEVEEIIK